MTGSPAPRWCARCGRVIEWRAKWRDCWDEVRYCSDACRRQRRLTELDQNLETEILRLCQMRGRSGTICPSEAARAVAPATWEAEMERARQAARRLVVAGRVEILQKGRVVDPSTARGPIRIRITPS